MIQDLQGRAVPCEDCGLRPATVVRHLELPGHTFETTIDMALCSPCDPAA